MWFRGPGGSELQDPDRTRVIIISYQIGSCKYVFLLIVYIIIIIRSIRKTDRFGKSLMKSIG